MLMCYAKCEIANRESAIRNGKQADLRIIPHQCASKRFHNTGNQESNVMLVRGLVENTVQSIIQLFSSPEKNSHLSFGHSTSQSFVF